jgi:hypothetical protein
MICAQFIGLKANIIDLRHLFWLKTQPGQKWAYGCLSFGSSRPSKPKPTMAKLIRVDIENPHIK